MSFAYDVFVSYATHDRARVEPLASRLRAAGLRVWLDRWVVQPGDQIYLAIENGLQTSRVLALCLTAASLASDYVAQERAAVLFRDPANRGRRFVPVLLEDCTLPDALRGYLYVDYRSESEEELGRLIASCRPPPEGDIADDARPRPSPPGLPSGKTEWRWPVPWDFTAYIEEKRRWFVGRKWLFDELEVWWRDRDAPPALLLTADYGVGKSALMSELVHRDAQLPAGQRSVAGFHFCQHDRRETLGASGFIRGLASALAERLPAYRARVESAPLLQEQLDRATSDPSSAFEAAILNPLAQLSPPERPLVLLVDALDESLELEADELRRDGLVRLLGGKVTRLPSWLRLLVTSRRNPGVLERLKSFAPRHVDASDDANHEDVERYVQARCLAGAIAHKLAASGVSVSDVVQMLRERGNGKFLYVARTLDDLANGRLSPADLAKLPPGMEGCYLDAFERRFTRVEVDYEPARRLLGVMAAAREPLSLDALASIVGEAPERVRAMRNESLTDFVHVRAGTWALDHSSLREWLTGEDAEGNPLAGDFAVDKRAALHRIVEWGISAFRRADVPCPDHVVRHLAIYLGDAGDTGRLLGLLLEFRWLTLKLNRMGVRALLADLALGSADSALVYLRRTLEISAHILEDHPAQLASQLVGRLLPTAAPRTESLLRDCREAAAHGLEILKPTLPRSERLWRVLHEHTDVIQSAVFDPSGTLVLTGSADGTARLWDREGEVLAVLDGHGAAVNDAQFSPDGRLIATADEASGARIWRRTGQLVTTLDGPSTVRVTFSPDGSRVLLGCRDRSARIWTSQGQPVAVLTGHERTVTSGVFLPRGRVLTASNDGTARIWTEDGSPVAVLAGHGAAVTRALLSPDGDRILTSSVDGTCVLWDPEGNQLAILPGHEAAVGSVSFSADGTRIATASNDGTARIWSAKGEEIAQLVGHTAWVNLAVFHPEGHTVLTVSSDETARLWDLAGKQIAVIRGHTGWLTSGSWSPDGELILTASRDATARLWRSVAKDAERATSHDGPVTAVAWSPRGDSVLTTSRDGTGRLWRAGGEPVRTLEGHGDWVTSGVFGPDDAIVTTSADRTARVWNANGAPPIELRGHAATVNHAAFVPGGELVATASNDRSVRLWTRDGRPVAVLRGHKDAVNRIAVDRAGNVLASASNDRTVRLWHLPKEPGPVLSGHENWVLYVDIQPGGDLVVSASTDRTARVWRNDGTPVATLREHAAAVERAVFSSDGRSLLTTSRDGTARLWRPDGTPLGMFDAHAPLTAAMFLPDGVSVVAVSAAGAVFLWRGPGEPGERLDVDAPIDAAVTTGWGLVCGDRLGAVHFLRVGKEER